MEHIEKLAVSQLAKRSLHYKLLIACYYLQSNKRNKNPTKKLLSYSFMIHINTICPRTRRNSDQFIFLTSSHQTLHERLYAANAYRMSSYETVSLPARENVISRLNTACRVELQCQQAFKTYWREREKHRQAMIKED
jgi:hypothetical protein